jgi:transcriptional regulator with XRE-family HTH domain
LKRERSPVAEKFGDKLRRARKGAHLSQEELAHRAALHRTEVSLLERGERVPRIDTVLALTDALSVTPGGLLDGIKADGNRGGRRNA